MATATVLNSTVNTVRKTRRAYIGAHVMAFEFAQKRASLRFEQIKNLGSLLVAKGEVIEKDASDMLDVAKDKVADLMPGQGDAGVTLDLKPTRVVKKAKRADMSTDRTVKAAAKSKPKADAAKSGKAVKDKYEAHVDAAAKYDADVNPLVIKKIVDHLGIALNSRDGKFVACSDAAERETVAKSWLLKKLGVEGDMAALDAKVAAVCETMKADRMKSRVTFYYLLAKNEGKLAAL